MIYIVRLGLSIVFIYAGWAKSRQPMEFADSIASFRIAPFNIIMVLALVLPLFELVMGLLILWPSGVRVASLGIFIALAVFVVAIISAKIRGLTIDCGCFGHAVSWRNQVATDIAQDIILMLLAAISYWHAQRRN